MLVQASFTFSVVSLCDLGEISVVVSLHLQVEHFGFGVASLWDQVLIQQSLENTSFLSPLTHTSCDLIAHIQFSRLRLSKNHYFLK